MHAVHCHRPQDVRRLEAAAGAGGTAAGGHPHAVQEQQDALPLDVLETDVGCVRQTMIRIAIGLGKGAAAEDESA